MLGALLCLARQESCSTECLSNCLKTKRAIGLLLTKIEVGYLICKILEVAFRFPWFALR